MAPSRPPPMPRHAPVIRGLRALRVGLPQLRQTLLDLAQLRVREPPQPRGQPIHLCLASRTLSPVEGSPVVTRPSLKPPILSKKPKMLIDKSEKS